jgi:uncharacterized protein with LGFP repeats
MTSTRRTSVLTRIGLLLALVAGFLTLNGTGPGTPTAQAADPWTFQAGNIISDGVFYDANTMAAGDIQNFLSARNPSCTNVAGWLPCLKNLREDTWTRSADGLCDGTYWGGAQESAATIIYKVAQACGINPRVLLVMLQKEQGLVLASGSSLNPAIWPNRYRSAMGMGCPDTAACDSQYYGFFNQVYGAAKQLQRYATYPGNYTYRAGRNNTILFSPKGAAACGSSSVYIVNQATAGLYNYTPYQPNYSALAAGYGSGDSCGAYGNRNFFLYFTDWFGTTGAYMTEGAIGGLWAIEGGGGGYLGYPVSKMACGLTGGGCGQHFEGGSIYWSAPTGARAVSGGIRYAWSGQNWERGFLGYPTDRMDCSLPSGGCLQRFQGGEIVWTASTGARTMTSGVARAVANVGGLAGSMGYPTTDAACGLARGGCRQEFQGGTVFSSTVGGSHAVQGGIGSYWLTNGGETGWLGYPTGDLQCTAGGCAQAFEGAWIGWTATDGNRVTNGGIAARWAAMGAATSALGYPTADMVCGLTAGGCRQEFQNGTIHWSAAVGAWPVSGDLEAGWTALGGASSYLGYPAGEAACGLTRGGCRQSFQGGTLAWSTGTGAHAVSGGIGWVWGNMGGERSSLGYPATDMVCTAAGCNQQFENGFLAWTAATGVRIVDGAIAGLWMAKGTTSGPLGYPTGGMTCGLTGGGCRMPFQGGTVYWHPSTGAHAVFGGIGSVWAGMGADRSILGYPAAEMTCTLAGCSQEFQYGQLGWTPATGVHLLNGAIGALWVGQGAGSGPLGYPVADMKCGLPGGGCRMAFEGGTVYWSATSGTHAVSGAIAQAWSDAGGVSGSMGYPTTEATPVAQGFAQDFQGGRLTHNTTTGVVSRS